MNQNNEEKFPALGDAPVQTNVVADTWGQEIVKDETTTEKPKKKLLKKKKLKAPETNAEEFNFVPDQQVAVDFSSGLNFQQDFGFLAQTNPCDQSGNQFGTQPVQQQIFYTYPDPSQGYPKNVIQDQFGNLFEIQDNEYVENGQIYAMQDNDEQDYWNNYDLKEKSTSQQQEQEKGKVDNIVKSKSSKQEPKKATKKEAKPQPAPKPRVFKRLQKEAEKTEDGQQVDEKVVKQEKFSIKQLKQKEAAIISSNPDKYTEVDTSRDPINLVFIGHVDAGKSTLSGRVLMNAGEIDEKTITSFETEAKKKGMEGWFLAYAMDINEDERNKGKTVETGKAFFQLSKRRFTLLDAPGHKNYVPNMIMGACQSDMACLIISSKQGEFEAGFEKGGQTTEHVQLIRALGVQNLCCIVSKMDTCNWSQERYKYITDTITPWLNQTCGFENVTFIPLNAFDGHNIDGRVDPGVCPWYNGPSLFEYLNTAPVPARDSDAGVKIPILDIYKEEGRVFLYGKVETGTIFEDIYVTTMPYRKTFQIAEIYDAKDRRQYYAGPGENVKMRVKGIENIDDLQRGYMICSTEQLCGVSTKFQAEIQVLEMPMKKQVMTSGYSCVLHMHTAVQEIEISEVNATYDKTLGKMLKASVLKNGEKGIVTIETDRNMCLEKFENVPILGRFTLRDENTTIAFGTIKKYVPTFKKK